MAHTSAQYWPVLYHCEDWRADPTGSAGCNRLDDAGRYGTLRTQLIT